MAESHGCRDADGNGQPNATATSPGQTCPLRRPSAPCRAARVICLGRHVPGSVNNQPHAGTDSGAVFVPCRPPPSTTPPQEGMASTACSLPRGLSFRLSRSITAASYASRRSRAPASALPVLLRAEAAARQVYFILDRFLLPRKFAFRHSVTDWRHCEAGFSRKA